MTTRDSNDGQNSKQNWTLMTQDESHFGLAANKTHPWKDFLAIPPPTRYSGNCGDDY